MEIGRFFIQLVCLSSMASSATVKGASLDDVKSDAEALQEDLIEDLGTERGQEIKRHYQHGNCPYGYTYLPAARSCYKAVFESHSWTSAIQKCNELRCGSHLVAITSATENNAVKTFLAAELSKNNGNSACIPNGMPELGRLFWTSGQRQVENNCKSPYVWKISSDKQLSFLFTSWLAGEPNCASNAEFCVDIWPSQDFLWNDAPCSMKICPLCEYNP